MSPPNVKVEFIGVVLALLGRCPHDTGYSGFTSSIFVESIGILSFIRGSARTGTMVHSRRFQGDKVGFCLPIVWNQTIVSTRDKSSLNHEPVKTSPHEMSFVSMGAPVNWDGRLGEQWTW